MEQGMLTDWLPTTRREMELRGWEEADVVLFSADAYVDHPSFGVAVIGRTLEAEGLRVAIVPQPDWHGDLRDFRRLGRPRLWFGIAPGCMDSMVNKYTAARRLRGEDAYSPDGRHDKRPEYPTIVYTKILSRLYPDVPVVLGGIEASLRRLAHYDYWQDRLLPSVLVPSGADTIIYGMGERPTTELARRLLRLIDECDESLSYDEQGQACIGKRAFLKALSLPEPLQQTVVLSKTYSKREDDVLLHSFEECLKDKRKQAENFRLIEEESNSLRARRIIQRTGESYVIVNPPFPPMTTEEIDRSFGYPYTRMPHPKYKGKRIPAYEMIRHSVTLHRGCFGGCAFCTISAHQGKFIASRSRESILREVRQITLMPDFRGYITDLGGPSANMYMMGGRDKGQCASCKRPSCAFPRVCPNLNADHRPLLDVYRAVDAVPGVKKSLVGSGVRYDLLPDDPAYTRELITRHVGGRLKVAPEHTSPRVLRLMRKPGYDLFLRFKRTFESVCRKAGLERQQLVPYFISSHPGCTEEDMAELAALTKQEGFRLEQVQDFTPTPMTLATETFYTGLDPYTLEPVYSARTDLEKRRQRMFFFWYKPEERQPITAELRRLGRADLTARLFAN
ncbi:MAG: YgiQ family radical SAM protein [Prevotellaceae bacterium]|nr:YgiQ family radical SAM protein [Prevotellaceae bacterium]